jgi:hypothetical protein
MAKTFQIKRFANIGLLRRLDFELLIRLLTPYRTFLEGKNNFQWTAAPEQFSFENLSRAMLSLDSNTPGEFLRSLYFIDWFSNDLYFDPMLQIAKEKIPSLAADITLEDLVVTLWLECPDSLEQLHAEIHRHDKKGRAKRFESFFSTYAEPLPLEVPDDDTIRRIQNELEFWTDTHRRGKGVRLFFSAEGRAVWIMIRHGQPMKRENTVEPDGGDGLAFYRPEKFDTVIYYPKTGELAVCAKTKGEQAAYNVCLGKHCFGDTNYFNLTGASKYTLEPLLHKGRDALFCGDVPGIQNITLHKIHIVRQTEFGPHLETHHSGDVFETLKSLKQTLSGESSESRIVKTYFRVQFSDGRVRTVTVEMPNVAHYGRETDHELLNLWLLKRGFIISNTTNEEVSHETDRKPVLAYA